MVIILCGRLTSLGSYGGILTSMLQVNYPDCIYGAIASSNPSNGIVSDPDITETFVWGIWANAVYYETSIAAANKIKQAVLDFRSRMASGNFAGLQDVLFLCSAPNATDQANAIVYQMMRAYIVTLQENSWIVGYPFNQVINVTLALNDSMAILDAALQIYAGTNQQQCTDWATPQYPGVDPFLYIRHTYLPYPDGFTTPDSIWGPNLPNFQQEHLLDYACEPIFNRSWVDGGLPLQARLGIDQPTLEATERLLITLGTRDPAAYFEPYFPPNHSRNGSRVWMVDQGSHAADLIAADETDYQGLINARAMTLILLKEWLGYTE